MLWFASLGCGGDDPTAPQAMLTLRLDAPASVRLGEPIPLQLTVSNTAEHLVTTTVSCPGWEFDVIAPDGTVFFSTRSGPQLSCGTSIELAAGESTTFEQTWNGTSRSGEAAPAGSYRLVAGLWRNLAQAPIALSDTVVVAIGP